MAAVLKPQFKDFQRSLRGPTEIFGSEFLTNLVTLTKVSLKF